MSHALTLMQWLSPAFPVGGFAYSHGLEQAVVDGSIHDAESLHDWIDALVTTGSGRADAILLTAAHMMDDVQHVDATARAFAASSERLMETDLQGAAFCDTASRIWGLSIAGLTYPVAVGAAARLMDIPLPQVLPLFLHAFASNLVSATQRALPLGQTDGQMVLARLAPTLSKTAALVQSSTLDDLAAASFAADVAAMRHETLRHRIFRT